MSSDLRESLERAFSQSGMLFQAHPEIEHWETTRPGLTGEVVAFKNEDVFPMFNRLSVCWFDEGEEDDGYTYHDDVWVLRFNDLGDYGGSEEVYTETDEMIDRLVEIMEGVNRNRIVE